MRRPELTGVCRCGCALPLRRVRRQTGFSLLEVLVAFSIMALALATLYQATAGAIRNTAHLERHAYAVSMAASLLARHAEVPAQGLQETGRSDEGFEWRLTTEPLPASEGQLVAGIRPWPMHRVVARVAWHALARDHAVEIETLLPQRERAAGRSQ